MSWFLNTGTEIFKLQFLPLTTGIYFLFSVFVYQKLTLNCTKAFIIRYPLIASSVSPRVLLGLQTNLLE